MYTIEKYRNNIALLTSSLVIKCHSIGTVMNSGLFYKYGLTVPSDYHEWKYYMNISGVKHATNNDVMVTLIETGIPEILTKELLIEYPGTRAALDARLNSYKALLEEYPDDYVYINGCINPIDIDTAINATDGTILGYSKLYIEPQEYSLIRELSIILRAFTDRWYNVEYNITDELYLAVYLMVLFANIPNHIEGIRLKDARTSEANSFHIEHFFRSHLDLWDNVKDLKHSTIRWLYKNLIPLMNNVGTNASLTTVIDKIFTDNGIGLAELTLVGGELIPSSSNDVTIPAGRVGAPRFIPTRLNQYYNSSIDSFTTAEIVRKEIINGEVNVYSEAVVLDTLTTHANEVIGPLVKLEQTSKVLDFGTVTIFKTYNNNILETVLDNWLYLAHVDRYVNNILFIDPNTKAAYAIDALTGVIMFYYLLLITLGDSNPTITSISYRNRMFGNITKARLLDNLLSATGNAYVADIILSNLPDTSSVATTATDFSNELASQIKMYEDVWAIDSNVNNTFLSANIKKMVSRLYRSGSVDIASDGSPVVLKDYLAGRGVVIDVTGTYDAHATMAELFKAFTGFDMLEELLLKELYVNRKQLLDKLTSYTVQTLSPDISGGGLSAPYTNPAVNQAPFGYIQVTDGAITKGLEDNNAITVGVGNSFKSVTTALLGAVPDVSYVDALPPATTVAYSDAVIDTANVLNSTYAELLSASHTLYGPHSVVSANNQTLVGVNATVRYGGHESNPISHTGVDTLFASSSDRMVTATVSATAELLDNSHTVFGPSNTVVADNQLAADTPVASYAGYESGPTAPPTVDDVFAMATNNEVIVDTGVTAEILGSATSVYGPDNAAVANNQDAATGYTASNGGTPTVVTSVPSGADVFATASDTTVTAEVTASAEIVGTTYIK